MNVIKGLILLAVIFINGKGFASTLIYDESTFYSLYENPSEIINFTQLKDGTTYTDALAANIPSDASPYLHDTTSTAGFRFGVWENGWSDNFLFRGKAGSGFNLITRWNGNSIVADFSSITDYTLSILAVNEVSPLALTITSDTYSGFLGIVPDSLSDNHYVLSFKNLVLSDFQSGFSEILPVPVPPALLLFLTGFIGFIPCFNKRYG